METRLIHVIQDRKRAVSNSSQCAKEEVRYDGNTYSGPIPRFQPGSGSGVQATVDGEAGI